MKCHRCGSALALDEQFCGECGSPRPRFAPQFDETERASASLHAQYQAGQINASAYDAALKRLVIRDAEGSQWMLGVDSGEWYRWDGKMWARQEPPLHTDVPAAPAQVAPLVNQARVAKSGSSAKWFAIGCVGLCFLSACVAIGITLVGLDSAGFALSLPVTLASTLTPTVLPPRTGTEVSFQQPPLTATPLPAVTLTPSPTRANPTATRSVTPTPFPTATRAPRIAFVSDRDGDDEIYTMSVDGSDARRLTTHPGEDWHPAWSPDGNQIAYTSIDSSGISNLYIMPRDGSNARPVTSFAKTSAGLSGHVSRPCWSPNGKQIAFDLSTSGPDTGTYIYVINVDGTGLKRIAAGRDATWSPDGQRIAYSSILNEIAVARADGANATSLLKVGAPAIYLAWSPNGKHIAYLKGAAEGSNVNVLDTTTGKSSLVVEIGQATGSLNWSPDGKRLVYAPSGKGIWIVAIDNPSDNKQIAREGRMPAWSP